jgi:lipoate---protein ligase
MDFLGLTLTTLAENLALDEALLLASELEQAPPVLRIWEWHRPAVILGAAGVLRDDVHEGHCAADGIPILRRASGGGTVVLGPGCLLYTLVLEQASAPELTQIRPSYDYLLERLSTAIGLVGLAPAGISDLALEGRKVSGNAQQRKRHHLLHHGSLLYAFDTSLAERYLRMPPRQPAYRQARSHTSFLTNLPVSREDLMAAVRGAFGANVETHSWPRATVERLVAEKYGTSAWTYRR